MTNQSHPAGFQPIRRDLRQLEAVMDSYKNKGKLPEPTVCTTCGAVYHQGRWQWLDQPAGANQTTCPACHRIHDRYPAGYITLTGDFFAAHEEEILQLIRHREAHEKPEHPLQRIMGIEKTKVGAVVTTTDIHLARNIGEALHHAFQGELEFHFHPGENLLRVDWTR